MLPLASMVSGQSSVLGCTTATVGVGGAGAALAAGHHYMAHKTGFTLKTLTQALHAAGFATSAGKRRARGLDLWVVASKGAMDEAALRELAGKVLPA